MPIGTPVLSETQGSSTASTTTASFTPEANSVLLALCMARGGSATIPTIFDSEGGTWTQLSAGIDQGFITGKIFRREIGATPSAMTVTVESTSPTQTAIAVVNVTGAASDYSNFVEASSGGGTTALDMAPYAAGSIALGFYICNAGVGTTPPTGFTELYDSQLATNLRSTISYDMSNPETHLSWSGSSSDTIIFGLELKEPAGVADELTSQDIANAPSIETATLGLTIGLTAQDIAIATSIEESAFTQSHDLVAANLQNAPSIQPASLSQTHELISLGLTNGPFISQALIETGNPNYIKLRNAIRLMRRKSVRVIFRDEMWDDDNPEEL